MNDKCYYLDFDKLSFINNYNDVMSCPNLVVGIN